MPLLLDSVYQPPSFVLLDSLSQPSPSPLWRIHLDRELPDDSSVRVAADDELAHPIIEISSPTIAKTYIELLSLGATSPQLNVQVRRAGKRHMAIELGVEDARRVKGRIRLSTFQVEPRLHGEMLCVPMHLSETTWSELALDLPQLVALYSKLRPQVPHPGSYARLTSVRIYANCRLRRIWLGDARYDMHHR